MRISSASGTVVAVAAILVVASTGPAHAYIDPGSGSFVLQVLGMFLVGALFYFRQFFYQTVDLLKSLRAKILGRPANDPETSDNPDK